MKDFSLSKIFDLLILKSWWVFTIFLFALFAFEKGINAQNTEIKRLRDRVRQLEREIDNAFDTERMLRDYIDHHEDIKTIEFILMQKLGLIPKEHVKICFFRNSDIPK